MEGSWPFGEHPLEGRRFAQRLLDFWRKHVDPMEARDEDYRQSTLASAFHFMQSHMLRERVAEAQALLEDRKWPPQAKVPFALAVVVRARGKMLAIGVGSIERVGVRAPRLAQIEEFDRFLGRHDQQEGWLVLERLSRHARRDAPVSEREVTAKSGRRMTVVECEQEDRWAPIPGGHVEEEDERAWLLDGGSPIL